ncbi:MAG: leucine-rich repeat protein, partial [Longicatena caecimuris]
VKFHIHYDGADPSGFYDSMWAESWGISFGAYYEWKDIDISNAATNISAFMPEKEDNEPLLGTDDQVMLDNGSDYPDTLSKDEYKVLGEDIDGDGITDERTVLYANTSVNDDMAIANSDTIEKLVKADNDRFGVFSESAIVAPKEGYTYEITVRNAQDTLKNIVVYDLLEDAPKHRSQQEKDKHFEDNWWYGTFDGIITTGLEKAGIKPVIYYNADRDARISTEEELPNSILTKENGWYTEEEWLKDHKFADVKAVAVDLSKKMNGDDFEIVDMGSVSFRIHMISPNEDESKVDADHSNTANKNDTAVYAYNNSAYYSEKVGTSTKHTVIGNSVQVSQHELEKVEIVKAFGGDVPKEKQNSEFRFIASYNGSTYATQEYQLFKKIDGTWERQGTNRVYATEADGSFYLHADEKAVFDVKDKNLLTVEEEENPFWKVEIETKEQDEIQIRTYKNTYRPVLYAQKKLENDPKDKEAEVKKESFIFQAFADGEPMANAEYWLVDSVRTDGGIPKKLNQNVLKTDKDGKFTIKAGEIVALFPGVAGTAYEIKETQKGDDWFTDAGKDSVTGTMVNDGNSVSITNYYKWKDLYLKKELTHQKAEDCTQAFTFQVFTKDTPFANAEWVILKEDGTESDVHGTTDDEGKFSIALAGKTVKIKGFEAGTSFKIVEIDNTSDNYEAIQGTVEGTMPLYALKSDATIINDYILRPIRVTKMVSYDATDMTEEKLNAINDKEFTMTIKVNGAIYANKEFTIQRSGEPDTTTTTTDIGTFTIKNGQTIIFHDVGPAGTNYEIIETPDVNYPQIFPANGESSTGTIDKEGSKVTFVNGTENTLLIGKEYVVGDGDVNKIGEQYLETIKNDPTIRGKEKVTLKLEVQDANGDWKIWPSETQNVQVTDALTNTIETITWNANSTLTLEPWKQVVIPTLTAGDSYRLSESTNDQYKLYKDGASFIEITQKEPLNDGAIQDTIENKPLAIIKNQIIGKQQKSIIQKKMRLGSEEIPTGSQLVFRVESYDGKVWNPANEISYIVGDDNDWINNRIQKTKADGKITVEKTAKGYPIIYFTEHDVKINPSNPMKDSYRIVEILEESEDTWGILSGYLQLADSYNGSLAIEDANTFVNSNRTTPIEIAKALNVDSEQEFTFELRQVTRSKQEVITSLEDILESREGTNISYVIYDVTTNKQIATGNTGTTGEIKIKGNQYAGLDLPDDTAWTVSEKQDTPYILTDLSGTNDKTLQLTKNMMLIQAKAPIILADLSVETNEEYFIEDSKVDKSKFTVNALYSDGRVVSLSDDDYEINIDTVPKNVRTFDLTFTYTDDQTGESIKKVKSLKTIGTITLTKEMVTTGVIDANTGEPVVLNTGDVEIPEVIMYEGNPRVITSIGELAFYGNENITSIKMPDTIISIERAAFEKCSKITGELRIPNSVTSIGKSAFQECKGFTGSLIIPDTVTSIGEYAFYGCKGFTGNLIIPDSVTSIENGAFSNCSGFNGTLTISKSITSIKSYVFSNCSNLSSSLIIPDKVTSIENYAFYDCNGLTGKLIIPKSVTSIGDDAFSYCSGFTGDLVIPDSVTSIGEYAFSNCNGFTGSLTIGNSITSIEDSTFYGCNGFKGDLIIPDSVTSIEEYAFYGCNGFKGSLIIPDTVTSIGYLSFYGCNGFTGSLIIPKSVTSIGSAAFQGCTNLEKIIFTGNTDPSTMRNYPWDFDPGKIEWQPSQEGA